MLAMTDHDCLARLERALRSTIAGFSEAMIGQCPDHYYALIDVAMAIRAAQSAAPVAGASVGETYSVPITFTAEYIAGLQGALAATSEDNRRLRAVDLWVTEVAVPALRVYQHHSIVNPLGVLEYPANAALAIRPKDAT
jgi:hypothetical protein